MIQYERSFATHPKSIYWSKNNDCFPENVSRCTHTKYLFNCDKCPHEIELALNKIVNMNRWCAYCSNQKLCDDLKCKICFDKSVASQPYAIYWSNQNKISARQVFKVSGKKHYFDCDVCGHVFLGQISGIAGGYWCNYCANKLLCEDVNCDYCFNKSFASHPKVELWSDRNKCLPRDVYMYSSTVRVWFNCDKCSHQFKRTPYAVSIGGWCLYCSSTVLCKDIDCDDCYYKSFASHPYSKYWSGENTVDARDVFKRSDDSYLFNCNLCGHEFSKKIHRITRPKTSWCSYCSSSKLCDDLLCKFCFNKSFASSKKCVFLSAKYNVNPRKIFKSTHDEYTFDCNKCKREFKCALNKINMGVWCPFCINKTESTVYDFIKFHHKNAQTSYRVDWCKNKHYLPFDVVIFDLNVIVEIDGPQHFRQISNWQSPEKTQEKDMFKMNCAIQNGFHVIRILQEDIYYETYRWEKNLLKTINYIKMLDTPYVFYMCLNNEYDVYKTKEAHFKHIDIKIE